MSRYPTRRPTPGAPLDLLAVAQSVAQTTQIIPAPDGAETVDAEPVLDARGRRRRAARPVIAARACAASSRGRRSGGGGS